MDNSQKHREPSPVFSELGTPVVKFKTTSPSQYVRVYTNGTTRPAGKWIMKRTDIQGLSATQIREKFALPHTPTHYCDVTVPVGTELYTGYAGPQKFNGITYSGGGIQYEIVGTIPEYCFNGHYDLP